MSDSNGALPGCDPSFMNLLDDDNKDGNTGSEDLPSFGEAASTLEDDDDRIEVPITGADAHGRINSLMLQRNVYDELSESDKASLPKLFGKWVVAASSTSIRSNQCPDLSRTAPSEAP